MGIPNTPAPIQSPDDDCCQPRGTHIFEREEADIFTLLFDDFSEIIEIVNESHREHGSEIYYPFFHEVDNRMEIFERMERIITEVNDLLDRGYRIIPSLTHSDIWPYDHSNQDLDSFRKKIVEDHFKKIRMEEEKNEKRYLDQLFNFSRKNYLKKLKKWSSYQIEHLAYYLNSFEKIVIKKFEKWSTYHIKDRPTNDTQFIFHARMDVVLV